MEHPIYRVISVDALGGYRLRVGFDDGSTQVINFEPILEGEIFGALRAPELFGAVKVDPEQGTLVWPNGADFDPATLHDWPIRESAMRELAKRWALASVGGT